MEYLGKKVNKLKGIFRTSKRQKGANPLQLLQHISICPAESIDSQVLQELSDMTHTTALTTQIANLISVELQKFEYTEASIRSTNHLLTAASYILRYGNKRFAVDLSSSRSTLEKLQKINSSYYANKFIRSGKGLNYILQMIKQKAKFISNLIADPVLLQQQRRKSLEMAKENIRSKKEIVEQETSVGLQKDKFKFPENSSRSSSSSKRKSSKLVEIQEVIHQSTNNFLKVPYSQPQPSVVAITNNQL